MRWLEPALFFLAFGLYVLGAATALARILHRDRVPSWLPRLVVLLGWLGQTAYIGIYCARSTHHDFSSWSEILLLASWTSALVYLVISWVYRVEVLGAFAMPLVVVLALGAALGPTESQALPESVETNFLFISHVMSAFLAYASFFTAFVAGVMFLAQERQLKGRRFGRLWSALPSLEVLDRAMARAALAGVILFTAALGFGAHRAGTTGALGSQWLLEAKTVLSLTTWTFFVLLVGVRFLNLIGGRRVAYATIAGIILVVATTLAAHGFI